MDAVKILGSLLASGALSNGSGSNVLGNLLGSALGGGSQGGMAGMLGNMLGGGQQQQGGGMADMLGGLLGGGQQQQGGMAGMLGSLLGGGQQQQGGGIGGMLGSMLNGQQPSQQQGGMADMLGSLLGGGNGSPAGSSMGGLGNLLGGAVGKFAQAQDTSAPDLASNFFPQDYDRNEAEEQATLVIRAMINAAKADGNIDAEEQENIIAKLGNIEPDEAAFVRSEFQAPLDVNGFVSSVPRGMEQQIYAISLAAIDLDTQQEAQYLHQLAQGFSLSADVCNQLHDQVGAPKLYQ
ncbi:MAG: DUF533 domain-containing protein [Thiolinea sp.]